MRCMETRTRPDGVRRRRYRDEDGRMFTTLELPAVVVRALGAAKVAAAIAKHVRGIQRRQRAADVRAFVYAHADWKNVALANELGVNETRIRRLKKEIAA
jgi:hypothetical protein